MYKVKLKELLSSIIYCPCFKKLYTAKSAGKVEASKVLLSIIIVLELFIKVISKDEIPENADPPIEDTDMGIEMVVIDVLPNA